MRTAIYTRRSELGERDHNWSIESQERQVRDVCTREGDTIVAVYYDPGEDSWSLNRPDLQRMLADAKAGTFDRLAFWRWDRLSREPDHQREIVRLLDRYHVQVYCTSEPVPPGPVGDYMRETYAFIAKMQRLGIQANTQATKLERVRHGKLLTGACPLFGYVWADPGHGKGMRSRYLPDTESVDGHPSHAPFVVAGQLFQWALDRIPYREMRRRLQLEHVPTPSQVSYARGMRRHASPFWSLGTIRDLLINPAFKGAPVSYRTKVIEKEVLNRLTGELTPIRSRVLREEDDPQRIEHDETVCPGLVSAETWEAVQQLLPRNKREPRKRHSEPGGLLRGMLRCGYCGNALVLKFNSRMHHYRYTCGSASNSQACLGGYYSWGAEELDEIAWKWMLHVFSKPEVLRAAYEEWLTIERSGHAVEQDRLSILYEGLTRDEQALKRAEHYELEARDDEEAAHYHVKVRELRDRLKTARVEINKLEAILGHEQVTRGSIETIITLGKDALTRLSQANDDDKRSTLVAFGVQMTVWGMHDTAHAPGYAIKWRFDELHQAWLARHSKDSTLVFKTLTGHAR